MVVTNRSFYLLEANKSIKQKHCLPLNSLSFTVTQENDKVLMVKIPEELIKKDKVFTGFIPKNNLVIYVLTFREI